MMRYVFSDIDSLGDSVSVGYLVFLYCRMI